jgi:hypothetical protein
VEALEDEGQLILGDADARIRNFKRDPVAVLPHTYRDVPALGRVAYLSMEALFEAVENSNPQYSRL